MPKHMRAKVTTAPSPTPASWSAPRRATNAVDARVMTENDRVETQIGPARRTSSRTGRAVQDRSEIG